MSSLVNFFFLLELLYSLVIVPLFSIFLGTKK